MNENNQVSNAVPVENLEDLSRTQKDIDEETDDALGKKYENSLLRAKVIKAKKELNDVEAQLFNSEFINDFGKVLIKIFFCKFSLFDILKCKYLRNLFLKYIKHKKNRIEYILCYRKYKKRQLPIYITFLWIILYAILYYCFPSFVVVIDKIGLFLIIFVLGKFLKDILGYFVHNRDNNTKFP